jgi:uncharacterized protein (TIGR03067 family)
MRLRIVATILFLATGCLQRPMVISEGPERHELYGKWQLMSVMADSGPMDPDSRYLTMTPSGFNAEGANGSTRNGTYKLDDAKSPRQIDLVSTTHTETRGIFTDTYFERRLGIYKVDGDTLTLCLDMGRHDPFLGGDSARPTSFARNLDSSSKNFGRFHVFVYQREFSSAPRPTLSVSTSRPPQVPGP